MKFIFGNSVANNLSVEKRTDFKLKKMGVIQINTHFNGSKIRVSPGDLIEIKLDETPVTGYKWEVTHADPLMVELAEDNFTIQPLNAVGGGGVRLFRFKVIGSGQSILRLSNIQPWSKDVYQTFELTLK
jgi:predicted secreted protein